MRPDVLGKVVRAHELLVTVWALEALLPCVSAPVPLQLIGACKALPAVEPVADKGALARVPSQVSAQVRCLAVHLAAAGDVANVLLLAGLAAGVPVSVEVKLLHAFRAGKMLNMSYFDLDLSPSLQFGQVQATRRKRVLLEGPEPLEVAVANLFKKVLQVMISSRDSEVSLPWWSSRSSSSYDRGCGRSGDCCWCCSYGGCPGGSSQRSRRRHLDNVPLGRVVGVLENIDEEISVLSCS